MAEGQPFDEEYVLQVLQLNKKFGIEDRRLYARVVEVARAVMQQTRYLRKRSDRPFLELTNNTLTLVRARSHGSLTEASRALSDAHTPTQPEISPP